MDTLAEMDLYKIWYQGVTYVVSEAAMDAFCDFGADVAAGDMTAEEASYAILRGEGFAVTEPQ